jgi:hypothetical protein
LNMNKINQGLLFIITNPLEVHISPCILKKSIESLFELLSLSLVTGPTGNSNRSFDGWIASIRFEYIQRTKKLNFIQSQYNN